LLRSHREGVINHVGDLSTCYLGAEEARTTAHRFFEPKPHAEVVEGAKVGRLDLSHLVRIWDSDGGRRGSRDDVRYCRGGRGWGGDLPLLDAYLRFVCRLILYGRSLIGDDGFDLFGGDENRE